MTSYRETRIYGVEEIRTFLAAVDRHLAAPCVVLIIGGAAVAVYSGSSTNDVDTDTELSPELVEAIRCAREETKLEIPWSQSTVAEYPGNSSERFLRYMPELTNLVVWMFERHDLVLSKTVRGNPHDDQQIEEMHHEQPLDFQILVDRFRDEMGHVVGDPRRLRLNFLELIERLFGELSRVTAERALPR